MRGVIYSTLILAAVAFCTGIAHAESRGFSLSVSSTFSSLYMIDGFRIGGDHPVWQPSIELNTPLTGFSLSLWTSFQLNRKNQEYDEYDLMAWYRRDFMTESRFGFNLHGYLDYWNCPKLKTTFVDREGNHSSENTQGNKLHAGVSFNRLFPLLGSHIVPTYNFHYSLFWAQNQGDRYQGGARHELMLNYYRDIPKVFTWLPRLYFGVGGSANYETGVFDVQPGWSHTTGHLGTGILMQGWSGYLSLNKQWSYIDSVNPNDELWTSISFTKYF